eukprot:3195946-Amphidinium_carterae.1
MIRLIARISRWLHVCALHVVRVFNVHVWLTKCGFSIYSIGLHGSSFDIDDMCCAGERHSDCQTSRSLDHAWFYPVTSVTDTHDS